MILTDQKSKALLSTKKAIGTAQKVHEMIEHDVYCIDVIQQIDAVIGHLRSTKKILLSGHLNHCLQVRLKEDKDQTVKELMRIYTIDT